MSNKTIPGARRPSPACVSLIKSYEMCRTGAYLPTPDDVPTIGWGSTGRDIRLGMVWTLDQCNARFDRDLAMFAAGVDHLLGDAPTAQFHFDALVSFAYNVGLDDDADTKAEGLGDSTLLKLHKAGKWGQAALEFAKWNKQNGKVLRGLTKRRAVEAEMYLGLRQ